MKSRMNYIKESILDILSEVQAYQTRNPEIEGAQVNRLKKVADRLSSGNLSLNVSPERGAQRIESLFKSRGVQVNRMRGVGASDIPSLTQHGSVNMPDRTSFAPAIGARSQSGNLADNLRQTTLDMGAVDRAAEKQFPGVPNVGYHARQAEASKATRMGIEDRNRALRVTGALRTKLNPLSA